MKIIVVGDIHGDFQVINHLVETERPDIILQCGDFGYFPRLHGVPALDLGGTLLYWCDGNHEDHQVLSNLVLSCPDKSRQDLSKPVEILPNCFYQPRGSTLKLPDGRNVLFFGGADSSDKDSREEGKDWFSDELPGQNDLDRIDSNQKIDIVISHTCPNSFALRKIPPEGYEKGPWLAKAQDPTRLLLDQILRLHAPAKWFFGHFHIHQTGRFQETEWQALSIPLDDGELWWVELE
ncbi:MAG: hypothetical protein BA863_03410 [Desulfovibrio sp. S3730MH75]|nr:MAG: hypothetical protein BA863_03410 [Desulfovibrio sp. S3730MH75]